MLKLSSKRFVSNQIKELTAKRDYLQLLNSLTDFKDCQCLFDAKDKIEGYTFQLLRQEHLPFDLGNEFRNLIIDAIDQYEIEIASLSQHFKTL